MSSRSVVALGLMSWGLCFGCDADAPAGGHHGADTMIADDMMADDMMKSDKAIMKKDESAMMVEDKAMMKKEDIMTEEGPM